MSGCSCAGCAVASGCTVADAGAAAPLAIPKRAAPTTARISPLPPILIALSYAKMYGWQEGLRLCGLSGVGARRADIAEPLPALRAATTHHLFAKLHNNRKSVVTGKRVEGSVDNGGRSTIIAHSEHTNE